MNKVIISGGGTGGHIFPAIAIANQIKAEFPEVEILFIGAEGKMEMKKVPEAGYKIEGLPIRGLQRKLSIKNLLLPFKIIASLRKAKSIIIAFQPDVVIGVGGYASAPTLYEATKLKIPTVIQEQNSFPGKTNRFLGKRVTKICVAYNGLERFFPAGKIEFTGNPVRKEVVQMDEEKVDALDFFKLNPNQKVILVVGGSLGARTLNESIVERIKDFQRNDIQVLWQCGKMQYKTMKAQVKGMRMNGIVLVEFIKEMNKAYAVADIIVSRAGAIAIAELCIIGKPTILVPSPNVAEDHQTKNAMALVEKEAVLMVKDSDAREMLVNRVFTLAENEEEQKRLANNCKKEGIRNADERIVQVIKEVVK